MPIHHYMTSLLISSFSLTYYHMKIIKNLFLSGCSLCSFFCILYISEIVWCVFWNAFLEENKGVHKLAARTAIRQSQWLEKNNYPEAGLLRVSSTTDSTAAKVKRKNGRAHDNKINKSKLKKHIILTSMGITEHDYYLKTQDCFAACYGWLWLYYTHQQHLLCVCMWGLCFMQNKAQSCLIEIGETYVVWKGRQLKWVSINPRHQSDVVC